MAAPAEPAILVVEHDLRGDFNNALAVAGAIARARGGRVRTLDVRLRANALLPLLRWALPGPARLRALWPLLFRGERPQPGSARAVIGTLGRGEPVAAAVAALLGVPAIQIGAPKRVHPRHFAAVIAHQGQEARGGEIALPLPPTRVTLAEARRAARDLLVPGAQDFALLMVGGPTRTVPYGPAFWGGICTLLQGPPGGTAGRRWLITTSQRTPPEVAQNLARLAQESPDIADIDLFDGRGGSRLLPYLGLASAALVTGESLSMIADALGAELAVAALTGPETGRDPKIAGLLALWEGRGLLRRVRLDGYAGGPLDLPPARDRPYWSDALWAALEARRVEV